MPPKIACDRQGDVHIVRMYDDTNSIDPEFVGTMNAVLDAVEAESAGNAGMVLTGEGKFFCNGLDMEALTSLPDGARLEFGADLSRLLGRLLTLPFPTVAAINGHAFAAGAILALTCDYRVMRRDRGWICLSEVDAGVPIVPAMMALARAKLPAATVRSAVLEGRRFTAPEAVAAGFVDRETDQDLVVPEATELAASLAVKQRGIFGNLKRTLWADIAAGLEGEETR
jgi:enoyl-CoA hydratase/carnithine racemase